MEAVLPDTNLLRPHAVASVADPYLTAEHELFRDQVRRFVDTEVKPHAEAWEEAGSVPREVLRRMGELGFLGVRCREEHGGSGMDTAPPPWPPIAMSVRLAALVTATMPPVPSTSATSYCPAAWTSATRTPNGPMTACRGRGATWADAAPGVQVAISAASTAWPT